jgi:hypothetical protein
VTTIQINPKNQRRHHHAGSSHLAAPESTSMISVVFPNVRVRVAQGLLCPCGRQVKPTDIEVFDGTTRMICQACHRSLIEIER